MKKHKGSMIEDVLPALISILCCAIVLYAFLMVIQVAGYREDVKYLMRAYLLEMETEGYLSPEDMTTFQEELADLGLINIDISGTTTSAVGYGQPITIRVEGDLPVTVLNTSAGDMFHFFFENGTFEIAVQMKSTAKH